jgi:hypothetical protein
MMSAGIAASGAIISFMPSLSLTPYSCIFWSILLALSPIPIWHHLF